MKGTGMLRSQPSGEERRGLAFADAGVEIRDFGQAGQRFTGYASVFNVRTAIGNPLTWGFYEQVVDGTFSKTLSEGDARMLIDHDSYYVVSRVSAGTLQLSQDARGLLTDSALDSGLYYVEALRANVANRNITGMSFGFHVIKDDWAEEQVSTSDGHSVTVELRTIREVKLVEVSAVTFPAYEETTAGLRHSLVPALLRRGDREAIARAARHRPDLAGALGYDEDLARTVIDLGAPHQGAGVRADDPKKPYGDVDYADPGYQSDGVHRYPLDTKEHVKAAWSYINVKSNADKYTAEQLASIKAKIKAAAKKFDIEIDDDDDESKSGGEPGGTTQQPDAGKEDGETEPAASTRNGKRRELYRLMTEAKQPAA
jgi:hypothetical protein